jgi:hypothetical protein
VLQHLVVSKSISCNKQLLAMCDSCCIAKSHKLPFVSSTTTTNNPLEIVHCDVWGPSPVISHTGFRYYVLFTDQYSKFNWIFFCATKSVVATIFEQFKVLVENLLSCTIKTVQTDGGTEFKPIIRSNPDTELKRPFLSNNKNLSHLLLPLIQHLLH